MNKDGRGRGRTGPLRDRMKNGALKPEVDIVVAFICIPILYP